MSGPGSRARSHRACAPSGCAGAATSGWLKTGLQQVCTAAAMNVSRIVHWLDGSPRATDARDPLCRLGAGRLNSPTVSHLHPHHGRLCLSGVILDLFARRGRGLCGSAGGSTPTLTGSRRTRKPGDRRAHPQPGCSIIPIVAAQYAAEIYREVLDANGLVGSMGRRGNPYDNAKAESFMKTLKVDGGLPDGLRDL